MSFCSVISKKICLSLQCIEAGNRVCKKIKFLGNYFKDASCSTGLGRDLFIDHSCVRGYDNAEGWIMNDGGDRSFATTLGMNY